MQFVIKRGAAPDMYLKIKDRGKFDEWYSAIDGILGDQKQKLRILEEHLPQWCNYIQQKGLETVGVFRVSGEHSVVKNLYSRFLASEVVDLESEVRQGDAGVANVASLVKLAVKNIPGDLISVKCLHNLRAAIRGMDAQYNGCLCS